jgi:hypothetical protein
MKAISTNLPVFFRHFSVPPARATNVKQNLEDLLLLSWKVDLTGEQEIELVLTSA